MGDSMKPHQPICASSLHNGALGAQWKVNMLGAGLDGEGGEWNLADCCCQPPSFISFQKLCCFINIKKVKK